MLPPEPGRVPRTEDELLTRVRMLAGYTIGQLAERLGRKVPEETRRAKGFFGQLLEPVLGATASSRSTPDFERLGVEMKTVPMSKVGVPLESTYVCTVGGAGLETRGDLDWGTSRVRHKLCRVLWVPIQGDPTIPLADRRIGAAVLWTPDESEEQQLRRDFDELMEYVRLGRWQELTGHLGAVLQVRPKGDSGGAQAWGVDDEGRRAKIPARGFYLRPAFTGGAIRNALNRSRLTPSA